MTASPLPASAGGERFPGFNVLSQAEHWDDITRNLVASRVSEPAPIRFFTKREAATAHALFNQLLDQHGDDGVPVLNMVDRRLSDGETDGWHYDTMPPDAEVWRRSLAGLDHDCADQFAVTFCAATRPQQDTILRRLHSHDATDWHGMNAAHLWDLWMRYACTAFYSHPSAWSEIGFDGPAYPRGYKNLGVDRREPFEVPDAHPTFDPAAGSGS